ncbi:MAG: hypothetical protein A2Z88_07580 [Omnitrophica WOR_2 bacterium GWA2_47_8]|nr:MAG: hypothetical protein A2Z88_07580 [Omnitrophica WOR_2 bacterium GWA2_47_8]
MVFFAYLISFLLGYCAILNLLKRPSSLPPGLHCALGLSLGLGISGLLTFYGLLLYGRFDPALIIIENLGLLSGLIFLSFFRKKFNALKSISFNPWDPFSITVILLFLTLTVILSYFAQKHPFGEWDAWSLWNMKLKFLIYGADHWKDIFQLHWHTQPDYPLLLPCINAYLFAFDTAQDLTTVTLTTSVVLALLCGWTLLGGLKLFIDKKIALLACALLLSHPYYIMMATSQYTDILLGLYLLAGFITLKLMIPSQDKGTATLTGLFLGLLAFTKNEGIALSLLLIGLYAIDHFLVKRKKKDPLFIPFTGGFLTTLSATLVFKFLLAPPNRDILNFSSTGQHNYFGWNGLKTIIEFFILETVNPRWHFLWIFIGILIALKLRDYFRGENRILTLFFTGYLGILLFIYLTTTHFDLTWRLTRTVERIFFYLMPSVIFLCFSIHWQKKES